MAQQYVLVVKHKDGSRHSWGPGTKAECEAEAERKRKEWGKRNTEALIEKR